LLRTARVGLLGMAGAAAAAALTPAADAVFEVDVELPLLLLLPPAALFGTFRSLALAVVDCAPPTNAAGDAVACSPLQIDWNAVVMLRNNSTCADTN
jgi:hypothetical protein